MNNLQGANSTYFVQAPPPPAPAHHGGVTDWGYFQTPLRKPAQREGAAAEFFAASQFISLVEKHHAQEAIKKLKEYYIFRNEDEITSFLLTHRSLPSVLIAAVPELKISFGDEVLLHLEVLVEELEPTSLYAIAIWKGDADQAETRMEAFDERWWFNQSPQHGLTFTYELA